MANPKFTPSKEDRRLVEHLSGCHVAQPDIAKAVINKATGKPISLSTLKQAFRSELRSGSVRLRGKIIGGFVHHLNRKNWPAVQYGLRYLVGLNEQTLLGLGLGGRVLAELESVGRSAEHEGIRVTWVAPNPANFKDDPPPTKLIEHKPTLLSDDGKGPDWGGTMPRAALAQEPSSTQPGPTPASKVAPLDSPEYRNEPLDRDRFTMPSNRSSIFDRLKKGGGGQGWMS
jgi:hypothetical protein